MTSARAARSLEEAVDAYQATLEVFKPAGGAFYINLTEANLACAETLLAERRKSAVAK